LKKYSTEWYYTIWLKKYSTIWFKKLKKNYTFAANLKIEKS